MTLQEQIKTLIPEEMHNYVDYAKRFIDAIDAKVVVTMEKKDDHLSLSVWGNWDTSIDNLETYVANIINDVQTQTTEAEEEEEEEEEED